MTTPFDKILDAYQSNMFASLENKIDIINLFKQLPDLGITNDYQENLYHLAARFTDTDAIYFLKKAGLEPSADEYGNTPLHTLTSTRFDFDDPKLDERADEVYHTTKALLEAGVNPKKKTDYGKLAYFEAGMLYMYPFLQAMGEAGVKMDITQSGGQNLLHIICDKLANRKDIRGAVNAVMKTVRILLEKGGIDIEDKDVFDCTALTYAQRSGVKEVAALISGDESDVATGGMTVHEAVLNRDVVAIDALIKAGGDLKEIDDKYRRTALMLACEYPSAPSVILLVEGGADVNFKLGTGQTVAYFLVAKAMTNFGRWISQELAGYLADLNPILAEELIDGAKVNLPNLFGKTPLMSFAQVGNEMKYNIAEFIDR